MSLISTLKPIISHPLNQSNKLKAIFRFIKWQIGSRTVPGEVIFSWVNNSKIIAKNGETGLTGNIYCGLHEFEDMAFLLHALRPEDVFIDIGANVGSYTILACSAIGARGYCFEPVPSTYKRLIANIRINAIESKVTAMNVALGDSSGEIHFSADQDTTNHVIADNEIDEKSIIVPVAPLDEKLQESPFLMKIDVEGYETPMLNGATKTLENPKLCAVIMELNDSGARYGYDESKIVKKMLDFGFQSYSYQPFKRELLNLNGKNLKNGNTIFIRNLDKVKERLKTAPMIRIHEKSF